MLTREFLKKIAPTIKVIRYDLDAIPGNDRKEEEAGAFVMAHHFDYDSYIVDFAIEPDRVIIFIKRK